MAPHSCSDPRTAFSSPSPTPSCEMQSQESVRLAQPPDPYSSQHPCVEHVTHVLGFVPKPLSAQCPHILVTGPWWCWGSLSPASCPGSTKERDGCLCQLFITVLKTTPASKDAWRHGSSAHQSLRRALLFAWLLLLHALGWVVSSRTLSLFPGCASHWIPLDAAGAGGSGAAV